jgi:hypothetical protein
MVNIDKITDTQPRPIVIATRLTIEEYKEFREWKNNSKSNNNSIAIRKAIKIAMNKEDGL